MTRDIKESDWKLFRRLQALALERYCQQVLEEVHSATADCSAGYHDCYLKVYALLQRHDQTIAWAFNNPTRSTAFILLANINQLGLLTEEELAQFSPELREAIRRIESIRRS